MELTVTANTVLKPSTAQSSDLPANVLVPVEKGQVLPALAYLEEAGHLKITLDPEKIDYRETGGKNTFWIYSGHIEDPAGFGPSNNPKDQPPAPAKAGMGTPFTLPGFQGRYWSGQPVHKDAPNVSWGEALHFNGGIYRAPENAAIVNNIIQVAKEVQKIRDMYGKPVRIHSFFRDSATNKRVGGARFSQHTLGSAVDLSIPGVPVMEIYRRLDPVWPGGLAYSTKMGFCHIDIRNRLGGGRARWAYPGG